MKRLGTFGARTRAIAASLYVAVSGCSSLKHMTADFEKKWDDPEAILTEMDKTAPGVRAADSSAAQMAAVNANDCTRKFKLSDTTDEAAATLTERRLSAGECLLDAGKDAEAARVFAEIVAAAPSAVALQGQGVALVRLARFEEALVSLQSAVDLDAGLWRAWNAMGVATDYQGRSEDAWVAFRKAAELNPADGAALNNLGVSLLKAGRQAEAIDALQRAMGVDGARDAAEANLRLAYAMDGDYAGATGALTDDRRAVALNNAGVAAASRGDKKEARRLFTKALDESPDFYAKAYNNLSVLLR